SSLHSRGLFDDMAATPRLRRLYRYLPSARRSLWNRALACLGYCHYGQEWLVGLHAIADRTAYELDRRRSRACDNSLPLRQSSGGRFDVVCRDDDTGGHSSVDGTSPRIALARARCGSIFDTVLSA